MIGDSNITVAIITAIGTLATSIGLPHLFKYYFGHLSEKSKYDNDADAEIQKLKLQINQIVTSVDLLLIVIRDHFDGEKNIKSAIDRVEEHLHGIKQQESDERNN